jgi:hypothetical protein
MPGSERRQGDRIVLFLMNCTNRQVIKIANSLGKLNEIRRVNAYLDVLEDSRNGCGKTVVGRVGCDGMEGWSGIYEIFS